MKKLLLIITIAIFAISCSRSLEEVRQVKIGMSANELKYIMGDPFTIHVEPGYETWYFSYSANGYKQHLSVTMVKDTVKDFYSY